MSLAIVSAHIPRPSPGGFPGELVKRAAPAMCGTPPKSARRSAACRSKLVWISVHCALAFGSIELANRGKGHLRAASFRRAFLCLKELAPYMSPAARVNHFRCPLTHAVIDFVAVGLKVAFETTYHLLGDLPAAAGSIVIENHRRLGRASPRYPHVADGRVFRSRLVHDLHGGLIKLQQRPSEADLPTLSRAVRTLRGRDHPVGHCAAGKLHPDSLELLLLSVQGKAIAELARYDVGQKARAGDPLVDERWRHRCDAHRGPLFVT